MQELFSESDKARIADAIAAAESRTAGELVCVVARASSEYRTYPLVWAAAAALAAPLPLNRWTLLAADMVHLIQLGLFISLALVFSALMPRLWFVPRIVRRERARRAAQEQFTARGLSQTAGRTGVLIYLSLAERYAEVIADEGIAAKVGQEVWKQAIEAITDSIRAGRAGEGMVAAVGLCGSVLAQHFPPTPDDRNELPNHLILL